MARALFATGLVLLLGCTSEPLEVPPADDGAPVGLGGGTQADPGAAPADDYALIEYPAGPYGRTVGAVIENLEFLGWRDPLGAGYDPANFEIVRLSDFYDPSGDELKYIVLNASAVWCTVCRAEYRHFKERDIYATYRAQGVELVGALFEDAASAPAKPEDLAEWSSLPSHAVEFPMVLDPGFKLGSYFTSDATPLNLLIDARTMRIVDATMGYDPSEESTYWQLVDSLLATP